MAEDRASPDAIAVALRVGEAIESAGGAYFVGGSLASSLQGEPRATNDIDLVIDVPVDRIADLVDALGDDFEVDVDMLRDSSSRARRTLSSESCSGTSRGEASRNGSGATSSKSFA